MGFPASAERLRERTAPPRGQQRACGGRRRGTTPGVVGVCVCPVPSVGWGGLGRTPRSPRRAPGPGCEGGWRRRVCPLPSLAASIGLWELSGLRGLGVLLLMLFPMQ